VRGYLLYLQSVKIRFLYRTWRARLRDQRVEIAAARTLIQRGDCVADIGANKGAYLFWLRRAAGRSGAVLAFEPQPSLAGYLNAMVAAFGWTNVHVHDVALSNRSGTSLLHVPGAAVSPSASLESSALRETTGIMMECRVETLDNVLARERVGPLRFAKIDVEGHELAVFKGAEATLRRDRPYLLFECEQRHLSSHTTRDVFAFLERLGYDGYLVYDRGFLPIREFDPAVHQKQDGARFWAAEDYFNNFLFVPTGFDISVLQRRVR
jgi:FkbM family methyltransferase